jgi:hypothetical protein
MADSLAALRRLTRPREPEERCELCSAPIPSEHRHLIEVETRMLVCCCRPCSILFSGQAETKYRLVPSRVLYLQGFRLEDQEWDSLLVPVSLACFTYSTPAGRVMAFYPSLAGATESQLGLDTWRELEAANPTLAQLEPDVEALLVNRVGDARDHFVVPIDECYRLVGLVRLGWRGLSGGSEVWREIASFFSQVRERAKVVGGA